MSTALRRRPARLALVTAAAVAAGALGVLPAAPANAAQTGQPAPGTGELTWEVSQLLGISRPGFPAPQSALYTAPATYSSPLSTWKAGSGTVPGDGSAAVAFDGASLHWATTGNAWIELEDLAVSIDATGTGTLKADVSYGTTTGGDWATATTKRSAEDLTIVDLSPTTTGTNYPYGDAAFGFAATASTYTWTNLKGLWSPQILAFVAGDSTVEPAIPAYTYASTIVNSVDGSSRVRYPSPFTFSIDRGVADTGSTLGGATAAGVPLSVTGEGFKKTAPGVYASIRESEEGDPAYAGGSVQADAPTIWVSNDVADTVSDSPLGAAAGAIADDGSFAATLPLTPEFIESYDPTKVYTLVTRKGHGQGQIPSNADQVTERVLDLSSLATLADARDLTTAAATVADSVRGAPADVVVTVDAAGEGTPDGTVIVKNGDTTVGTGTLSAGTATIPVSGLPVGTTELTVEYAGSSAFWTSAGATSATVTKATSAVTTGGASSTTYGKTAVVTAAVPAGGTVTLTGLGATQAKTLAEAGTASFTVPASLAAGAYTATFAYGGNGDYLGSEATKAFSVAKATTRTVVKVKPKATSKKAGKATVTVTGAAAGSKVTVVIKGGGKKAVTKTVRVNAKGVATVALAKAPKGGSFVVTASYAGDANHGRSSGKATYKVTKPKKK